MSERDLDAVIFDCDGVLVDSERISGRVFASLLNEIGLSFTPSQSIETFMGSSMARCVAIVTERLGAPPPEDLLDRYHAHMQTAIVNELTPVDGIVALLDALDAADVPYAVASNGAHSKMVATLGVTKLLSRFEGRRFSATDVAHPKPAPDLFLHAANRLRVSPARCVVIEDSPLGVQGAVAAGMHVIGYADLMPAARLRDAGAHIVVDRIADLAALLAV